jgi:tetratricopeptide (TPR) repeat protein
MMSKRRYLIILATVLLKGSSGFVASLPNSDPSASGRKVTEDIPVRHGLRVSLDSSVEDILEQVREQHSREVQQGFETFGRTDEAGYDLPLFSDDDDFDVFSVGVGNSGPTENSIERGTDIFRTKKPIVSAKECQDLIEEAQQVIAVGMAADESSTDGRERSNSQLNEAKMSDLPKGKAWLEKLLHTKLFPMLESRYGVDAGGLTLNDALIIGYIGPSRSQPVHRDASLVSLQIALSPTSGYTSGGTYFEGLETPILMQQGHVLCHSSGSMHAGRGVETGERWVLVFFALLESEPQLARRCHAEGVMAMDQNDVDKAELCYRAGLEVAPNDHLLRMSLAKCFSRKEEDLKAREQLRLAKSYELCSKACVTHANILMSKNRPRAALRNLELALERIGDKDLAPDAWTPLRAMAWELRVQAGRCACLCAEREAITTGNGSTLRWTRTHLPVAIERLRLALQAAPGHQPLQGMLARAEELLELAQLCVEKS